RVWRLAARLKNCGGCLLTSSVNTRLKTRQGCRACGRKTKFLKGIQNLGIQILGGPPITPGALRTAPLFLLVTIVENFSSAQSLVLDLPRPSQRAQITQRIGITDVTISYHRPLINNRKVWGDLVPYGKVWRAGANENTTITFSDPVMIEGKALDR